MCMYIYICIYINISMLRNVALGSPGCRPAALRPSFRGVAASFYRGHTPTPTDTVVQ